MFRAIFARRPSDEYGVAFNVFVRVLYGVHFSMDHSVVFFGAVFVPLGSVLHVLGESVVSF